MKLRTIAIAASAVACGVSAFAAPFPAGRPNPGNVVIVEDAQGATSATYSGTPIDKVLFISGASASSRTLATFLINDNCDASTLSIAWDSSTGANQRAYLCNMTASNIINGGVTGSLLVVKRDQGGSTQGVTPIFNPTKIAFMNFQGCSVVTGATPDIATRNYTCTGTQNYFPDAGTSDLEPAVIAATINGGSGTLAVSGTPVVNPIFQLLIGVAVNKNLYLALQKTQGLVATSATAIDEDLSKRPSLPSSFISSLVNGKLAGGAASGTGSTAKRGWGLVVSETVDPKVHYKQLNLCRRAAGSGTQAAANLYFSAAPVAGLGALGPVGNTTPLAVTGNGTSALLTNTSATLVENCLTAVDALVDPTNGPAYAIGHLGREADPKAGGTDRNYRYVKLNGAHPESHPNPLTALCDGPKAFEGCTDAQTGKYDYVYESTLQWNTATPGNAGKLSLLQNIVARGFTSTQLQGNTPNVVDAVMALPSTYTGLFPNLPALDVARIYASRVTRNGNSFTPLTLSK